MNPTTRVVYLVYFVGKIFKTKEINLLTNTSESNSLPETTILVSVILPANRRWEIGENLCELELLAETSGVKVADRLTQERPRLNSAYFIGKGKVEELSQMVKMYQVQSVIFDDDLTPVQVKNLEKSLKVKIIDRSTLILDIFAKHARTRAAKTQVELAQLQYLLPRLTRAWTHLSRQVGGIGAKGPGETQLETDRRLIRKRIEHLRAELQKIDLQRTIRRKGRKNSFKVSLVGYTNVGKSTIMNVLSGANVLVENQLFATLDPTVRQVNLDQDHQILLSDTVGFIRKLPHHLIESFKTTLYEALEADLLLHVVDVSHPAFLDQIKTVDEVLEDIKAGKKPVLMVFNKIDLLQEKEMIVSLQRDYPQSVFISAVRQIRTEHLKSSVIDFIETSFVEGMVEIPMEQSRLVNTIHNLAVVIEETYSNSHISLKFRCTEEQRQKINSIVQKNS